MAKKVKNIVLSDEQKEEIKRLFSTLPKDELNLLNITRIVFKDESLNGQSCEGRELKKFLGEQGYEYGTRTTVIKGLVELTDDQKKKLDANLAAYIKREIKLLELTRIIFEDENLSTLSQECRTVSSYLEAAVAKMDGEAFKQIAYTGSIEDIATDDYRPPKRLCEILSRINKYVVGEDWKEATLKNDQKKKAESLLKYLNTFRVKYEISTYPKQSQRDVFEDAFIRYTYDKVNLDQSHLDQFCTLASERVNEVNIKAQINLMVQAMEAQNSESEGRKIAMGLVEAITSSRTELNQCLTRQDKLYKALVAQRSAELDNLRSENATILNLVIPWKQEEFRKKTIHLALAEKQKLKEEVGRLSSFDEIICLLKGIDPREMYGDI